MIGVERHARTDGGNCRCLCRQHDFVGVTLGGAETAINREGAADVGRISRQFATGVDQHQRTIRQGLVVFDVVQHAGVGATRNDGQEGVPAAALTTEFMADFGLQGVFGQAGAAGAHGAGMGGRGDRGGTAHQGDFMRILDEAPAIEQRTQVVDLRRSLLSGTALA